MRPTRIFVVALRCGVLLLPGRRLFRLGKEPCYRRRGRRHPVNAGAEQPEVRFDQRVNVEVCDVPADTIANPAIAAPKASARALRPAHSRPRARVEVGAGAARGAWAHVLAQAAVGCACWSLPSGCRTLSVRRSSLPAASCQTPVDEVEQAEQRGEGARADPGAGEQHHAERDGSRRGRVRGRDHRCRERLQPTISPVSHLPPSTARWWPCRPIAESPSSGCCNRSCPRSSRPGGRCWPGRPTRRITPEGSASPEDPKVSTCAASSALARCPIQPTARSALAWHCGRCARFSPARRLRCGRLPAGIVRRGRFPGCLLDESCIITDS